MHKASDLKMSNVLVSNAQYCQVEEMLNPLAKFNVEEIVCKLTDFGEGRSAEI